MTKSEALQRFWSSFTLPAYEENSVPDDATYPYITYEAQSDSFGSELYLTGNIWYRTTSWILPNGLAETISQRLTGGYQQACDGGGMLIFKGQPFAQRMGDDRDDQIKRILLNITVEFLTLY